jgi:peptide deformylase
MANMTILTYGNDTLRKVSKPVEQLTPKDKEFISSLGETMYAQRGVGLAAPQVGVLKRILVLDIDQVEEQSASGKPEKRARNLQVFINPEITWESDEDAPFNEGCLSVPGIDAEVYRPTRIRLQYRDTNFKKKNLEASGLLARVLQHEIDHLNGKLFIDHLSGMKRALMAGRLNRLKKETRTRQANQSDTLKL